MIIIGIDPGKHGAIAFSDGKTIISVIVMPQNKDMLLMQNIVRYLGEGVRPDLVILEKVHAMPGNGGCSMFTFGTGYGQLLGMCQALAWPFQLVTPQAWQKKILIGMTKCDKPSIPYVQAKYPNISLLPTLRCKKPHDGMADAICLAEYGMKEVNHGSR